MELVSTVRSDGVLELSVVQGPTPDPEDDEILVRMEAAPINPSDLRLLLGSADVATLMVSSSGNVTAKIPAELVGSLKARHDQPMRVGNEGAGIVVKAGRSLAAQALVGKTVGVIGGATYAEYKKMRADSCIVYPAGVTAAEGASWFVNPFTALGMIETMRMEHHKAIVHTAAASNLGQMLARICKQDGIGLVCIVRKQAQVELLKGLGCEHIVDSSSSAFIEDLTAAIKATGATLAFDATGGGAMATQILSCMEAALTADAKGYSAYGSPTHKQVYIYGGLDRRPTMLNRDFGMFWSVGGWLLTGFLQKVGPSGVQKIRDRVAAEITTTFKSNYTQEISLAQALDPDTMKAYAMTATGEKFLINPSKCAAPSKL